MTRRDQSINARLQEIRDLVRSGATEMTGKTYRDTSGKIAGRFGGGFTDMYPELKHASLSPSQAAAAIERGEGAPYERGPSIPWNRRLSSNSPIRLQNEESTAKKEFQKTK